MNVDRLKKFQSSFESDFPLSEVEISQEEYVVSSEEFDDAIEELRDSFEDYESIHETMVSVETYLYSLREARDSNAHSKELAVLAATQLQSLQSSVGVESTVSVESISESSISEDYDELIESFEGFKDFLKKIRDRIAGRIKVNIKAMRTLQGFSASLTKKLGELKNKLHLAGDGQVTVSVRGITKHVNFAGEYPHDFESAVKTHMKSVQTMGTTVRKEAIQLSKKTVMIARDVSDEIGKAPPKTTSEKLRKILANKTPIELIPHDIRSGKSILGKHITNLGKDDTGLVTVYNTKTKNPPNEILLSSDKIKKTIDVLLEYAEYIKKISASEDHDWNHVYREWETITTYDEAGNSYYIDEAARIYFAYIELAFVVPYEIVSKVATNSIVETLQRGITALHKQKQD